MGMPENTGLPHQPFGISIIISLKRCIVEQEGGKHSNSHYGSIAVIPAWMPESSAMDGDMSVA